MIRQLIAWCRRWARRIEEADLADLEKLRDEYRMKAAVIQYEINRRRAKLD